MLLEMADFGKNASVICKYMGVSRKTYYQIKKAYDEGGVEALAPKLTRVPNCQRLIKGQPDAPLLPWTFFVPLKPFVEDVKKRTQNRIRLGASCSYILCIHLQ